MNNLCNECGKRDLCAVLCPEAELYVKQDHVGRDELPVGLPRPGPWPEFAEKTYLSKKEKEITALLGRGLSRSEICQTLGIKRKTLRNHLWKIRKKWDGFPV